MADDPQPEFARRPDPATRTFHATGEPGALVGPYRLLERIGEGGMGEVWLAEQIRPMRRQVAVKVIKAGMDTAQVIARFEAERQALALMDHPAIAKVLDAGATLQGRPYFVMEYVRGESLVAYCDRERLTIRDRLDLFVQVCEGIQHAHQKGIIHRDLKPSNVLVTRQDDRAVPKIIDFGVAKAVSQRFTERTLYTSVMGFVGTPEYMSPEQAEMGGVDIDTRTDVYALGVCLYELLTGVLPFERREFDGKPIDEIGRTIREVDPVRPSTRVTRLGAASIDAARKRHTEPARLASLVRGDLDWITMRALEKDRSRRYGSASDLAADLRRYLTNQPVMAGPPSAIYRSRKFVQRHRFGVAVAAVLVLLLASFAGTMAVQAERIARERDRANSEAVRANSEAATAKRVSEFLVSLFRISDPSEARGATLTARTILDRGAARLNQELTDEPALQAQLMQTISEVYTALGLFEDALRPAERAWALRTRTFGESHLLTARARMTVGMALTGLDRLEEAEQHFRAAFEKHRTAPDADPEDTLKALNNLAVATFRRGRIAEAEGLLEDLIRRRSALYGADDARTMHAVGNRAAARHALEDWRGAEAAYRQVLEHSRKRIGSDHPDTLRVLSNLGELTRQQGRLAESDQFFQEALAGRRRVLGAGHTATALTLSHYADLRNAQGRHAEAEQMLRESLGIYKAVVPNGSALSGLAESRLGEALVGQGKLAEAESVLTASAERLLVSAELMKIEKVNAVKRVIDLYERWGKPAKAAEWRARLPV